MIRAALHAAIDRFGRHYDYDATYMHEILDTSRAAFLKLLLAQGMNQHHDAVPAAALFAARIAAVRHEDCGPCAQLTLNMAREAGVASATLKAIVTGARAELPAEVALAQAFAEAVLAHAPADELRERVRALWGERGLVTLAYAISATRIYPTMKRVLGHAQACELLAVDGEQLVAAGQAS
ncbi:MAG: hypothetical protein R3E86_00210 [Pseudomonadales bacterium]